MIRGRAGCGVFDLIEERCLGSVTINTLSSSKVYWQLISASAVLLKRFIAVLGEDLTQVWQLISLSLETMNE